MVIVNPGTTVDLNGKKLTATYVIGLEGSNVIDSLSVAVTGGATKTGGIYAPKANVILSNKAVRGGSKLDRWETYIPVYVATEECYRLIKSDMRDQYMTVTGSMFTFMPIVGGNSNERKLAQKELLGTDNIVESEVSMGVRVTWETDGYTATQVFTMKNDKVQNFINSYSASDGTYGSMVGASFTGAALKQADKVYISAIIVSSTGVELESMITPVDTSTLE